MRFQPARTLLPALVALLLAPTGALAQTAGLFGEFKLPEGLVVLTAEDHSAPKVVIDTWIGVGSAKDFEGHRGIALALARTLQAGMATDAKAWGGSTALEVDRDATHIQLLLPASKLEEGLQLAGRVMAAPAWDAVPQPLPPGQAPLETLAFEGFMAQAYGPDYGHPPTGNRDPAIAKATTKIFYDRYYVPSRVGVVLAGDFATGKAVGSVVRSYASVLKRTTDQNADVPARQQRPSDGLGKPPRPLVVAGVKGPAANASREQAAMELVGQVLGSRLELAMMRIPGTRLVEVTFKRYGGPSPLTATIEATPAAAPAVEQAVRAAFDALRQTPATLEEHARAQQAVATARTIDAKNPSAQARALGWAAIVAGDPHLARTYPEIVRQISRQDMLEIVQKFATPDAVRVVTLTP